MTIPAQAARVTLLERARLPRWLKRHVLVIAPGDTLPYAADQWSGALAVLEHGSLVLEGRSGERVCLDEGAVFCLAGVELVAIHNEGQGSAVVATVRRLSREGVLERCPH